MFAAGARKAEQGVSDASRFPGWAYILLIALASVATGMVYSRGLVEIESRWSTMEQYSHGYMIPFVALFLLWQKAPQLRQLDWQPWWWSIGLFLIALFGWALGELSALFIIVHYSLLLAIGALVMAVLGRAALRLVLVPLAYLVFMIPLPVFILNKISAGLQLISTDIGVAVIRLFDISVYSEGNIIDLGVYQLQVVEACSGLNYLFPLMSFGFLIAAVYEGPNWRKAFIFLATIPITVLMNSLRIGIIGVTVEYWGIEAAEGFLHTFEGWFVFMACLAILFILLWLLHVALRDKRAVLDCFDLSFPTLREVKDLPAGKRQTHPTLIAVTLMALMALPGSRAIDAREEITPARQSFSEFPLLKNGWIGREALIEDRVLDSLRLTDYVIADYVHTERPIPVNLYIAYYESQRNGAAIHSPRSCIPGGGWEISELTQLNLSDALGMDGPDVNRAVIQLGEEKQLVYYWFQQRGRTITNEYLAKWYLFQDSLTMSRSDGSLVRLITPMAPGRSPEQADERLVAFLRDFYTELPLFLPGAPE